MKNLFIFTTDELRVLTEAVSKRMFQKEALVEYNEDYEILGDLYDRLVGTYLSKLNQH